MALRGTLPIRLQWGRSRLGCMLYCWRRGSLYRGIDEAIAGKRVGDIGFAVESYCTSRGYGVSVSLRAWNRAEDESRCPQLWQASYWSFASVGYVYLYQSR